MRVLAALALLLATSAAHAGWWISADAENFRWEEDSAPSVTEKGARYGLGWGYLYERPAGWQFAYRGEFRRGEINYTGAFLFTGAPTNARTRYTGLVNELQGIHRFAQPLGLEFVAGLGYDYWARNILPDQREEYSVVFARLGLSLDPRAPRGFFGGGGMKLPFYVNENAHLDQLGFDRNEPLHPKGQPSLYAQAGYRFTPRWSVIGYYDSYRFGESPTVRVKSSSSGSTFLLFQPGSTINTYGLKLQYYFR
jgi:hypothetical protein